MLGIAASFLGGILSNRSQSRANKRNIAFQREANAANIASAERLNMLNIRESRRAESVNIAQTLAAESRADKRLADAKAYADPMAERERLESAGFNPAAFLQNNAPAQGSAIAANSAPLPRLSMASAQAANVQAVNGFANSFSEVGRLIHQRENL